MSATVTIELPESVVRAIERVASERGLTLDQFIARAATEKLDAIVAASAYFNERAKRADWDAFERVFGLDRKTGKPPLPGDEID